MHEYLQYWPWAVMAVVLIAAAISDLRSGRIYNWITYPAIVVGLLGHTLMGGLTNYDGSLGLVGSLIGLAAGGLPMFIAWRMGGLGGGDVKLMAAVGALGGWRFAIMAMFYGFAAAAVMGIIALIRRRMLKDTFKRLLRFVYLTFTPARAADPSTPQSPKIPLGLAFCIGAAAALIECLIRGFDAKTFLLGL